MKFFRQINFIIITLLLFVSCTHEYEPAVENNWRIDVSLSFDDPEFWPQGQELRVGVFEEGNLKQATESVLVNKPSDKSTTISLNNVAQGIYNLQLYLTENGIFKVVLADLGEVTVSDNVYFESESITLLSYSRVQNQVFNNCQLCHGGSSGDLAASLNLTAGNSFEALVNKTAQNNSAMKRVLPGSANYSYLVKVLNKDIEFDHAASSSATKPDKQLIIDWINEGAKNN